MFRKVLLILSLVLCYLGVAGQHLSIRGEVMDLDTLPFPGVQVQLLTGQQIFLKGKLTDLTGNFRFDSLTAGKYQLTLTAPEHDTIIKSVLLSDRNPDWGLGRLYLFPAGHEIGTVSITSEIQAVSLKGDTVEFNAEAFEVKAHHTVEDLLEQFPGLEVANGTVVAHGEEVTKILVNGKEFYGGNVKEAIQNFPADAISKVQVYDKASDEAEFLGIEDEDKEKTINLKLKRIRKGSLFGDIGGSYGVPDRYRASGNLNRFVGTSQFALHANSFNQVEDQPEESQNLNQTYTPVSVHLATDMGKKTLYNGMARYERTRLKQKELFFTIHDYDSLVYRTDKNTVQNRLDQVFWTQQNIVTDLDSTTRLTARATLTFTPTELAHTKTSYSRVDLDTVNQNRTASQRETEVFFANAQFNLLKKLRKPGRSVSVKGTFLSRGTPETRLLDVNTLFFSDSLTDTTDFYQNQLGKTRSLTHTGTVKFSEQLTESWRFTCSANYNLAHHHIDRDFFDLTLPDAPLIDSLSGAYANRTRQFMSHGRIRYKKDRTTFYISAQVKQINLSGNSAASTQSISKNFLNVLPRIRWIYKPENVGRFELDYRTRVLLPQINQLQTIQDNSDPLKLYIGNPDLRTEYLHLFKAKYLGVDKERGINASVKLNFSLSQNRVMNTVSVDPVSLVQTTRPVNLDNYHRGNLYASLFYPIPKAKIAIDLSGDMRYVHAPTLVNESPLTTVRVSPGGTLELKAHKIEHLQASIGTELYYNQVWYDGLPEPDRTFLNTSIFTDLTYEFADVWEFNAYVNYTRYTGGELQGLQVDPFIRTRLARTFLKDQRGRLEVEIYDVLNRQVGIYRSTAINYLEERQVNYPGRVILLTFSYSFQIDA